MSQNAPTLAVADGPAPDARDDRFEEEMAELQREAQELARKPTLCEKIKDAIMDAAPDIGGVDNEDLSKRGLAVPLIVCYFLFWFGALCYFTVTLGMSESRKIFVGLEKSDTTICVEVPLVSTGTYFFDDAGNWDTAEAYNYNTSIYKLTFEGSVLGDDDYAALMSRYTSQVQALGAKAKTRNAAWNWLAWSEFEFKDEITATKLSSNADPNVIFNQDTILTAISSSKGLCTNNKTMSSLSSSIDTQYSGNGFQISYQMVMDPKTNNLRDDGPNGPQTAEGICSDQGGVQHLWGWSESSSPNFDFSINFEAQTLMDTIALNMGMRPKESFTYTSSKFTPANLGIPAGNFWLNAEQAPGQPIFCLDDSISKAVSPTAPDVCFYAYGSLPVLVYPVMVQFGDCSSGECLPCDCSSDAVIDSVQCNQPQVIFGLFYNLDGDYTDFASGVLKMAMDNQKKVVASGDDAIATATFKLLASVTQLQTLNSMGNTNNKYCPGGPLQQPNKYGKCNILMCDDDMHTVCTKRNSTGTSGECNGKDLYIYDAKTKKYKTTGAKMGPTTTCQGYCTNGNGATNNVPCSADADCPGFSGLTCPAYTSTKTNPNYLSGVYNNGQCPTSTPSSASCFNCKGLLCSDPNSVQSTCCDDTLCCNANTLTYDPTYDNHTSTLAAEYQALCGGDRCAAFSFVVDTTTSNFVSLNMWQVSLDGLTQETYQLENNLVYDPNTGTFNGDGTYSPAPQVMCTDVFYRDGAAFQVRGQSFSLSLFSLSSLSSHLLLSPSRSLETGHRHESTGQAGPGLLPLPLCPHHGAAGCRGLGGRSSGPVRQHGHGARVLRHLQVVQQPQGETQ